MHQAGIIADEQVCGVDRCGRGQDVTLADEVDPARPCGLQGRGRRGAVAGSAHGHEAPAVEAGLGLEPFDQLAPALGRPALAGLMGDRGQGDDRAGAAAGRQLRVDHRPAVGDGPGVEEDFRVQRGRSPHHARDHLDLAQAGFPAAVVDHPPLRRDQIAERRAPDVDDQVPACADHLTPQVEPVSGHLLLVEDNDPLDVRRGPEKGGRRSAAGHGDPGARHLPRNLPDHTGGYDAVADAVRSYEQDLPGCLGICHAGLAFASLSGVRYQSTMTCARGAAYG